MIMKYFIIILTLLAISGCAVTQKVGVEFKPEVAENKLQKEFDNLPPPDGKKVAVAVYGFTDKTGQRRPTPGIASLSTAVTQGAEVFLIKALQDVGRGQWFEVVERVGIDSLTRERTLIRQMREAYEGANAKPLLPLHFAGIIMEGGIIGYDSSTESGGAAHRFLGVGTQTQYSKDTVTVSLRAVSVNTGKVLVAVTVTKIVYSTADSVAILKFLRQGTAAFEAETGLTINEPGTLAVKATVEAAVVELIREGERKGIWDFKKAQAKVQTPVAVTPKVEVIPAPTVTATQPAEALSEPKPAAPSPAVVNVVPEVVVDPNPIIETTVTTKLMVTSMARIRENPSIDSAIIGMLKPGQQVEKLEVSKDWVKIRIDGKIGWTASWLLKELE